MNTENNNILIAQFMGVKTKDLSCLYLPQFERLVKIDIEFEMYSHFSLSELKYHNSWDWLMPVVQKILHDSYTMEGVSKMALVQNELITCRITTTHKLVVEFIKWYNKHS